MSFRIGTGYDIHKLTAGRPLVLGGIAVPFDKGLLGHSDGDALLHAISDSLLGALALGDIGQHFPDTDPKYKGADSSELLSVVLGLVREKGAKVVNLDVNIIAEKPKLMPYITPMRENIASLLDINAGFVSIKARTNEGLDAIGRGEAIAVHAIVLLDSRK